jgi:ribonuclease
MKTIYERSGRAYFTSFTEKSLLLCAYHFSPRYGTIKLYFYKEEHTVKKQLLFRRFPAVLLALLTVLMLALLPACGGMTTRPMGEDDPLVQENGTLLVEDGSYSTPEKVAEYLHFYGHLPQNYLTKQEAKALGWAASQGNLWEVAEGKSIGGDHFGNREGLLPEADGRTWYECDVNYMGGFRGAERLLYSSDGLIYYTDDHYASFTLVYGEEETP